MAAAPCHGPDHPRRDGGRHSSQSRAQTRGPVGGPKAHPVHHLRQHEGRQNSPAHGADELIAATGKRRGLQRSPPESDVLSGSRVGTLGSAGRHRSPLRATASHVQNVYSGRPRAGNAEGRGRLRADDGSAVGRRARISAPEVSDLTPLAAVVLLLSEAPSCVQCLADKTDVLLEDV